jgi:hypothetical protein
VKHPQRLRQEVDALGAATRYAIQEWPGQPVPGCGLARDGVERRLLLMPKCLRVENRCPAPFDEFGLLCKQCGLCSIQDFQAEAERLGYAVLVAEGSALVMAMVQTGTIEAAPLADNILLDRDSAAWKMAIASLKAAVGMCAASEPVTPVSAMEGKFTWSCERGRVSGRVQRAPTRALAIQALEFNPATP